MTSELVIWECGRGCGVIRRANNGRGRIRNGKVILGGRVNSV